MNPETSSTANRWQEVRRIFESAVELPADQRQVFLDQHCPDRAIRREVEELLRHESDAGGDFLRPPEVLPQPGHAPRTNAPDPLIGLRIGGFVIKGIIARGGMGSVYRAEQASPRRDVALKVLSAGPWSGTAERRFEFESQVLARLHHPNIAQVYEAGARRLELDATAHAGATVHYFAMEHIPEARPITVYSDERGLVIRDRLGLFVQVCDAVAYAHGKGVLHRDLKPGNILVDGEGCPKVIDFGVARATDSDVAITTMHTDVGQLIGTLAYMSPEQCEADPLGLDIRSDVYSLGVVLYEHLCGRLPYEVSRTSIYAATKTIKEATPRRPSGFSRILKGDLETILLKALEKDRDKRYASASDLAADIRRYLNHEPISARPPTMYSRLLRWAAKYPTKATAVASLAVVIMIGLGTAIGLHYIAIRPHRILVDPHRSSARLVSLGGNTLKSWNGGDYHTIRGAREVRQHPTQGGRRLAVLGFAANSTELRGKLCAFDIDGNLEEPIWTAGIAPEDMPDDLRNGSPVAWDFSVQDFIVADVFEGDAYPGPEIVACFVHQNSYSAVVVYNLHGDRLYGAWQDGGIYSLHWLSGRKLLVCCGLDERVKKSPVAKTARDVTGPVVFALKLEPGTFSKALITSEMVGAPVKPAWYRYIVPANSEYMRVAWSFDPYLGAMDDSNSMRLTGKFIAPAAQSLGGTSLILDQDGKEIAGLRSGDDRLQQNPGLKTLAQSLSISDSQPTSAWGPLDPATTQPTSRNPTTTE